MQPTAGNTSWDNIDPNNNNSASGRVDWVIRTSLGIVHLSLAPVSRTNPPRTNWRARFNRVQLILCDWRSAPTHALLLDAQLHRPLDRRTSTDGYGQRPVTVDASPLESPRSHRRVAHAKRVVDGCWGYWCAADRIRSNGNRPRRPHTSRPHARTRARLGNCFHDASVLCWRAIQCCSLCLRYAHNVVIISDTPRRIERPSMTATVRRRVSRREWTRTRPAGRPDAARSRDGFPENFWEEAARRWRYGLTPTWRTSLNHLSTIVSPQRRVDCRRPAASEKERGNSRINQLNEDDEVWTIISAATERAYNTPWGGEK